MNEQQTPLGLVRKYQSEFPGVYETLEHIENTMCDTWEPPCVLPCAAATAVLFQHGESKISATGRCAELTALYIWRKNKIIYQFDHDLAQVLFQQAQDTKLTDRIPVEFLMHLPFDCVYIKTDIIQNADGFFAWIEFDVDRKQFEFRIQIVSADLSKTIPAMLHLDGNTIGECINSTNAETKRQRTLLEQENDEIRKILSSASPETIQSLDHFDFTPVLTAIQFVLYLVSENSDQQQDEAQKKIHRPRKPDTPIRDKFREIDIKNVGVRVGNAIRKSKRTTPTSTQKNSDTSGTPKRAHLRRGHWHHFWMGKRDATETRKLVLRWVAPTMIHPDDEPDDSIVVFPVK